MLFLDDVQSVVERIQRGTGRDAGRFIPLEHSELNRCKPVGTVAWPASWLPYLPSTGPGKDPGCSTVNANSLQGHYSSRAS